ncbi:MAG: hypothetical protein DI603_07990 [Roseateles depolymerans]|uniref:Uncharacterized protein n=1 Tax=Roseateles depolymerans TaxID=76731 RepID=A0A2W5DN12_9BURK|nr:MAG: hypothetical protein DI603_07990 [Roseateles depolymerans]PZR24986.1 MAG: hypothetical protein DI538_27755 [Azospira oryzae]
MRTLLASLVLCGLLSSVAQADSFVSSAAGAGSASSGSVSDSLKGSSGSSSEGNNRRAEGRYRVTDVAQADAGRLRLTLARDGAEPLALTLPAQAAAGLTVGSEVQATPRPYGIEFARADTGAAFFLVLEDEWQRSLSPRVVSAAS